MTEDLQARAARHWPDPTPEMLESPLFEAIWQCIKSWDINVPEAYGGYCGATGNHVRAILDAISDYQAENAALQERLEIDGDLPDGISCRDATIRLQDERIDALQQENARMRKALEKAVDDYGKPGGPWNVPGKPGTWLCLAKEALAGREGE